MENHADSQVTATRHTMFRAYSLEDIPCEVADCLVLGSKLERGGELPPILRLRLQVMETIYQKRPTMTFTISGDEEDTGAMLAYLGESGVVPQRALVRHARGKNTMASVAGMLRTCAERPFVILTSSFHLPRCTYIADRLGADAYPFRISDYERRFSYEYLPREFLAWTKAYLDLRVLPAVQKEQRT